MNLRFLPLLALALLPVSANIHASPIESASTALRMQEPREAKRHALKFPEDERSASDFIAGLAALSLGEFQEAEGRLRAVTAARPDNATARLHLAEALAALGRAEEALALLDALPGWLDESELHFPAALLRGAVLVETSRLEQAEKHYARLLRRWSPRLPTAELLFRLGEVQERRRPGSGQISLRRVVVEHPESPFAAKAEPLLARRLSEDEKRARALELYDAREYDWAVEALSPFGAKAPRDGLVQLRLGKLHGMVQRDDLEAATKHLHRALDAPIDPPLLSEAGWRLSSVLGALGRTDEALRVARKHQTGCWGDKYRRSVDYRVARLLHEAGEWKKAREAFSRYVRRHKPRDWTMYYWFIGWSAFRGGAYEQAIRDFEPLTKERNILVGPKALYWTAEAQRRLGRKKQALRNLNRILDRFPLCYYAVLAQRKLENMGSARPLPGLDVKLPRPQDEPLGDPPNRLSRKARKRWSRLRWLVRVGVMPEARHVWSTLEKPVLRALGRKRFEGLEDTIKAALDEPHEARRSAWLKGRRHLTRVPKTDTVSTWRLIYPRAYRRYAQEAAQREPDVPELLLYCHMLQESRYKRFAISSAPAFGVMQFLLVTARKVAEELKVPFSRNRLFDPAYNIRMGAHYLAALAKRYGGQFPLAIAAYNGGPRLMDAHIDRFGALPFDEFIEEIDRHETRNYVRKVLDHYVRYVALYLPVEKRREAIDRMFLKTVDVKHGMHPNY